MINLIACVILTDSGNVLCVQVLNNTLGCCNNLIFWKSLLFAHPPPGPLHTWRPPCYLYSQLIYLSYLAIAPFPTSHQKGNHPNNSLRIIPIIVPPCWCRRRRRRLTFHSTAYALPFNLPLCHCLFIQVCCTLQCV